jgi:DNA-binding response OmpR family regulator/tetratricopeptide (TPR) repeat protein
MSQRILIAEDNPQISAALCALLQRRGFSPETAADGVVALTKIVSAPPDLLLLDLKLPRLHGVDLLKKLRESPKTRDLPVIVMSAVYKGDKYVQAALSLGVSHYLEKPFKPAALLKAIAAMLTPSANVPPVATAASPSIAESEPTLAFEQLLLQAWQRVFTGRCELSRGAQTHRLIFCNGLPVAVRPGFIHRDLGEYLRKRNLATDEECRYYREGGGRRPEAFVRMGCFDDVTLAREQFGWLAEELIAGFGQPTFSCKLHPIPSLPDWRPPGVGMAQIIYHGYRRHGDSAKHQLLRKRLGHQYVALSPAYYRHINFLDLDEGEREFLDQIDGKKKLDECLGDGDQLLSFLQTLTALAMLQFAEQPLSSAEADFPVRAFFNAPPDDDVEEVEEATLVSFDDLVGDDDDGDLILEPPPKASAEVAPETEDLGQKIRSTHAEFEGKNYYEIFKLKQGKFSFAKLKSSYFEYTRSFGPEVLMQVGGEEAMLVEKILDTVTTAYNTLSDVVKKESYDEMLGSDNVGLGEAGDNRFQAQVQYQSAKVFLEMEEWENATNALRDAIDNDPKNGEYQAHLAWSIYRNPKNANSKAMLDKARKMLNQALAHLKTADGFAYKGWILFESGQDNLAEPEFNKALKLKPRHSLARQGIREMSEKRDRENKGLFKRMFR